MTMETKTFEIRDRATFISAVGTLMVPSNELEEKLLRHAGYHGGMTLVLLTRMDGGRAHYDQYDWCDRTMKTAHAYIAENWADLKSGDVVDVEAVLGEK